MSLEATEKECAAVAVAPRVSLSDITNSIAIQYDFTLGEAVKKMNLTTPESCGFTYLKGHPGLLSICVLLLKNGFTIVGKSAPASPENFDADLGRKLAYEDAVRQIWPLMGFNLRQKLHESA
jgi:hypothetical protein